VRLIKTRRIEFFCSGFYTGFIEVAFGFFWMDFKF
jgi:hypothetical protein